MAIRDDFEERNARLSRTMSEDGELKTLSHKWFAEASKYEYSYHFTWMGRPIIQFPQDIIAIQEIIWQDKPDLIIETGIARGGSLIFYASMLELLGNGGQVLGIDIDIREHNRIEIERHPMFKNITMIEGSSIDDGVTERAHAFADGKSRVMVVLDSNHTHDHVLKELELYSPLVKEGSHLIVLDTIVEDMDEDFAPNRPWGPGDNPKTAVAEFLQGNDRFDVDAEIETKLLITVAPSGYLKCVKD